MQQGILSGPRSQQRCVLVQHTNCLHCMHSCVHQSRELSRGEATAVSESGDQVAQLHGCRAQAAGMDASITHTAAGPHIQSEQGTNNPTTCCAAKARVACACSH